MECELKRLIKSFRKGIILLLVTATIMLVGGCDTMATHGRASQSRNQINETRLFLTTYCTITIHGSDDNNLLEQAFELLEELETLLSMTIPGSDIYRINNASGEPVSVDARTIEVIRAGIEFGVISDGMFDITIGHLSRLWDFGNENRIPQQDEITEAVSTVDYREIIIYGDTVQLLNPDAWIDLGAIAKGFIADEIAGFLTANGITSAFIDIGGDITTIGNRYDGRAWRIAVRDPFGVSYDDWVGVMEITNSSVAGSGTYARDFEYDGVHYHHILDTSTGMPVISDVVSATVVAENGLTAEGLSTIAILAGNDSAGSIFESVSGFIGAVLVLDGGEVLVFGDISFSGVRN